MGEISSENKENLPILLQYRDNGDIKKKQAGEKNIYFF